MKLLVVDEELIAGGVETLRFELVPKLAEGCESLCWLVPEHARLAFERRLPNKSGIQVTSLTPPRGTALWLAHGLARRTPGRLGAAAQRTIIHKRVRGMAARRGSTHALSTCVFNQPPLDLPIPSAGLISDVNPVLPEGTKRNMLRWVCEANAIFAASDFTCDELRRLAPERAEKICALPLAPPSGRTGLLERQAEYDFFFPAAPNPHKGHATLLAAALQLASERRHFRLVLSGPGIDAFRPGAANASPHSISIRHYLEEHAALLGERVELRGDVSAEEVALLFESSRCVVLPSSYEGFGLPLAEALLRGCSIICSDIPAFREQLDRYQSFDRARLIPAGDINALATAMRAELQEPRAAISPLDIRARLARWTWEDAANRCLKVLEESV